MNPDDRAFAIAARIADGSAIDWPESEASLAGPLDPAIIEELKAISALATLHRAPAEWVGAEGAPAGSRWGPLTLLGLVGEGRFGQVYRAWDARLQRHVALKLLHASSSATSGSPTRAIEEARLLARVRHPNVLTVHGAESLDDQVGIWTEFIEGRTLEAVLAERGPLAAEDVVAIGVDLCRALAAVHDAGLLHRDVKAQNVMRETGGRIVLMDFGTGHDVELVPTSAGDLSGTPLYLAPELFTGGRPTVASDVYALAVLLFHLLTGEYPVPGRTLEDVRTGHRQGSAARLRGARPDLPGALVEAIERGLAADPSQRFESAGAFEAALRRTQVSSANDALANPSRWPAWATVGGGLAATGLVAWLLWGNVRDSSVDGPPASVTSPGPAATAAMLAQPEAPPVASDASREARPGRGPLVDATAPQPEHLRLAPPLTLVNWRGQPSRDGRYWPYVDWAASAGDLWIWEPLGGARRAVTRSADRNHTAGESAMSPDGRRVAFAWGSQNGGDELLVAEADGSGRRRILPREAADQPVPIEWSSDGAYVLCWLLRKSGRADLALVPTSGGAPRLLQTFETSRPQTARLSRDTRFVVYDFQPDLASGQRDVLIMGIDGSPPRVLIDGTTDDFGPVWTPDGRVFFLSNRSGPTEGWTLEVADGVAVGAPVRVAPGLAAASPVALTDDGAYYYTRSSSSTDVYTLRLDLTGAVPPTDPVRVQPGSVGERVGPSWSPDGKSLAYITNRPRAQTVSIQNMTSGKVRDLELTPPLSGIRIATRWSPDGARLLIRAADAHNRWGYFVVDVRTSAVTPGLLFEGTGNDQAYGGFQWSTDSKSILFRHLPRGIVSRELETGKERILVDMKANGLVSVSGGVPSPDGLSLAFAGDRGQGTAIMVQTGADPPRVLLGPSPGQAIVVHSWTPNGQEILFTKFGADNPNPVEHPHELWAITAADGKARDTLVRISGFTRNYLVALSRDGHLAFTLGEQLGELWVMMGFLPKPRAGKRP